MKNCAIAIWVLSAGFLVSAYGPLLPRWTTVVGTNLTLLAAAAVMCSGFAAFCEQREARPDRIAWGVVALTVLPFWYWGLIDPVGNYRTAVFSLAYSVILGRIVFLLTRSPVPLGRDVATWVLAILFGVGASGTLARGVLAIVVEPPIGTLRSANPTEWTTVAAYMLLLAVIVLCIIRLEFGRVAEQRSDISDHAEAIFGFVEYFRSRLLLLWAIVFILVTAIVSEAGLFYAKSYAWEAERLAQKAELSNDALVHHSLQVMMQAETLLHSVRSFYLRTQSVRETEGFIDSLPFDKSVINNVYIIGPQGKIVVSHEPSQTDLSVADRDYFLFHQSTPGDQIFIGSVESGRVTGKLHFRVSRRISLADGNFAGVVLATVNPESFSQYYRRFTIGPQSVTSLLGTLDRKLRARVPAPASDQWQAQVESVLWDALLKKPDGYYKNISNIDNIPRVFAYKKVADMPLVLVTGYSESDIQSSVYERVRWLAVSLFTVLVIILTLAALLTVDIRRRNEQERFMAMLSHELKTPLSVLRMSLSQDTLSERTREHAQQSVQDMDTIVYRCLQADRLQHPSHVVSSQLCQLSDFLANLQIASTSPQRLQIAAHDLPIFSTDHQLLNIALNNLVENALKYSPPQSMVQISASPHSHKRQPGILVSVTNAIGNAGQPDALQVFKKYYRSPRAHSKTGSGLGLYLVNSVVRLLGGWVRYAPAQDSVRFELWLPT